MNIAEIKSSLHQYIALTDDEKLLFKVQEYVKSLLDKESQIIGYSSDGEALTSEKYKKRIDQAINEADNGDVFTQEEMEKGL